MRKKADDATATVQHVMQRAMDAWDTTTHKKNRDGRLWQCMEELRGEMPMTATPTAGTET
jgi:hypothetical protein